jgi:sporulation protein YlmC with PRC-barrel domain
MNTISLKKLLGYKINAIDGEIGKVKEFYFDKASWTIRYIILETGSLFFGRKVMISTQALINAEWEKEHFLTNMTIQQIEDSPKVNDGKQLTRGQEILLNQHYNWKSYWDASIQEIAGNSISDLFHANDLTRYQLIATDGQVGSVKDFIIDKTSWKINSIVIDAFKTSPAKEIVISPKWIKEINANNAIAVSDHTIAEIKNNPAYNPEKISS